MKFLKPIISFKMSCNQPRFNFHWFRVNNIDKPYNSLDSLINGARGVLCIIADLKRIIHEIENVSIPNAIQAEAQAIQDASDSIQLYRSSLIALDTFTDDRQRGRFIACKMGRVLSNSRIRVHVLTRDLAEHRDNLLFYKENLALYEAWLSREM
jgi:hypothetical protein